MSDSHRDVRVSLASILMSPAVRWGFVYKFSVSLYVHNVHSLNLFGLKKMFRNAIKTVSGLRYFRTKAGNHCNNFKAESICSEENIARCIKTMQSAPQVKLSQKKYETKAAVLLPLCIHNNELSLLYTVRSAKLSTHVRQVSFPGGLRDSADGSWENCALRETEEEIGIPRHQIHVYGKGGLIVPARPPAIMPVIGFVNEFDMRALRLNSDEVESCFAVALRHLSMKENQRYTQFKSGYCVPSFIGCEKRIWGITGLITHLFLNALLPRNVYTNPMKFISKYRSVSS